MKKLISLAVLAATTILAFAYDNELLEVKGGYRSYTKTHYAVTSKFGDYFRTVADKYEHSLDGSKRTAIKSLNAKDELLDQTSFEYNADGTLAAMTLSDITGSTTRIVYEYEDSRIKSESEFNSDGELCKKLIYKYADSKTTQSMYDATGKLMFRSISTCDEKCNVIECFNYNADGRLENSQKSTYLDDGRISAIETFDLDGNKTGKTVYRYDAKGFISEIQIYATDTDIIERDIYKNDDFGNPKRISVYSVAEKFGAIANELVSITDYSYSK